jgi:hypothetical protein
MNKLLLSLIILLCCLYSHAQFPKKTDLQYLGYRGDVKSITTNSYKADEKFGEVVITDLTDTKSEYLNKQGYLSEYELKFVDDKIPVTEKYKYKNGLLVETKYNSSHYYLLTEKIYNKLGQLQEENDYDEKGDLYTKTKYQWSSLFNMSSYSFYDSDGKLKYAVNYDYDYNLKEKNDYLYNEIKSWTGLDLDANIIRENKVDAKDNLTQWRYIDSHGNTLVSAVLIPTAQPRYLDSYKYTVNEYSENGLLKEYYHIEKEKSAERSIVKLSPVYDAYGNLLEVQRQINGKKALKNMNEYSYTYDKNNNWIQRTETDHTYGITTFSITVREIKYY